MTELILSVKKEVDNQIREIGSLGLAVVYTIGHIIIAWVCATLIFNASFSFAAADAIIEPIINGFWFYILHRIAKNALVQGDVEGLNIRVGGTVIGDVKSEGQVVLRKNCVLKGDISYRKLHIEDGAQFEGQCDLVVDMNLESVNN